MSEADRTARDDPQNDVAHIMATVGRDPEDLRDLVFSVSDSVLASLPPSVDDSEYRKYVSETWHQRGLECTGFALAAIANYIFRKQSDDPDLPSVSRRMLYEMAQVYDDANYRTGSTPRGALKGWKKAGVASDEVWPYDPNDEEGSVHGALTLARLLDARRRLLVRYRSIPDCSIDTIRGALAEGHVLFASCDTHGGWYRLFLSDIEPVIRRKKHHKTAGDHAFVIVGYDETGFWVHNSWGPEWGREGYALLPYSEWDEYKSSAWVVDAVDETQALNTADYAGPQTPKGEAATHSYRDMWPHLVVLRDDGRLSSSGLYEMDADSVKTLLFLFQEHTIDWDRKRLAVFADGGYWATAATIERLRPVRDLLLRAGIYPIFVVWETAWFADLQHELHTHIERAIRETADDSDTDPALDRQLIGRRAASQSAVLPAWRLIRERSRLACRPDIGGARHLADAIAFKRNQRPFDLHLIAHGAGDLLLSELAPLLPAPVTSATLLASASPLRVFHDVYGPMRDEGRLQYLSLINLDETAENADSFGSLSGSLLNLVSTVLDVDRLDPAETDDPSPDGSERLAPAQPLLGLRRHLDDDRVIERLAFAGSMSVDTVDEASHVDLPFVPWVQAKIVDLMLRFETAISAPRPDPDPPLPRDPLERAEALRRAAARGE